jgi:hypothetical protein
VQDCKLSNIKYKVFWIYFGFILDLFDDHLPQELRRRNRNRSRGKSCDRRKSAIRYVQHPDFLPAELHRCTDETKLCRSIAKYFRFDCLEMQNLLHSTVSGRTPLPPLGGGNLPTSSVHSLTPTCIVAWTIEALEIQKVWI